MTVAVTIDLFEFACRGERWWRPRLAQSVSQEGVFDKALRSRGAGIKSNLAASGVEMTFGMDVMTPGARNHAAAFGR
jgi:hypothetical protein